MTYTLHLQQVLGSALWWKYQQRLGKNELRRKL